MRISLYALASLNITPTKFFHVENEVPIGAGRYSWNFGGCESTMTSMAENVTALATTKAPKDYTPTTSATLVVLGIIALPVRVLQ